MTKRFEKEVVVYDHCEPCPYLPEETARLPLRLPQAVLTPLEFDVRLNQGDRRTGEYLYRTNCPKCQACQPIRVLVDEFQPRSTMRRVKRKGDQQIRTEFREPTVDSQRVALFNKHRKQRGLDHEGQPVDAFGYEMFLTQSCCDTFEMDYFVGDELMGVAICDRGATSISAVYFYFDPAYGSLSPGVYSVLKQIETCQMWSAKHLYLGLYIAQSPHMSYKIKYRPHEILIDGTWRRSEES